MYFNPFELLGVTYKSSVKNLREQYKNLALIMHPDKGGSQDDMIKLHQSYVFIKEQLEFGEHDKTYEGLEDEFENFIKIQAKKGPKLPSLLDIIHDDNFTEKFNDAFEKEKEKDNIYPLSYQRGYENELKNDIIKEKAVIIYKEPNAYRDYGYSNNLSLKDHQNINDFTNYSDNSIGTDFQEAYSAPDLNFEKRFANDKINIGIEAGLEKLKKERENLY